MIEGLQVKLVRFYRGIFMGKTSRKLNIVVFDYLQDWPEIEIREEQGHTITKLTWNQGDDSAEEVLSAMKDADVILGHR